MGRFSYYHVLMLMAVVLFVPVRMEAQTASATLKGSVSKTVTLSNLPNSIHGNIDVDVVSIGSTVRMTLSSNDAKSPVIRVPLLVRSNCGFRISGVVESKTAVLTELSVIDVHPTGSLVSPDAINGLEIAQQFDPRGLDENTSYVVLSGPRVSIGGTLNSSNNALQMTLLIRMRPQPGRGWLVHLTFSGTAQ